MRIEIIQKGRVLRSVEHEDRVYVQAPKKGKYQLRVTNPTWKRRMAVISVDGVNVINGEDAGHDGPGYVLGPFESFDIQGFYRDGQKAAAFRFTEQGESYAAQTGRGTSNVGVIGMAVFDEKVVTKVPSPPIIIREEHHHHHPWPYWYTFTTAPNTTGGRLGGATYTVSSSVDGDGLPSDAVNSVFCMNTGGEATASDTLRSCALGDQGADTRGGPTRRRAKRSLAEVKDVGTAYGEEVTFHTQETTFERASDTPSMVVALHYATYERLKSWGVPIDAAPAHRPKAPNPFPASQPGVPAPPGWRG